MGAPKGNTNNLRNGSHSFRLIVGDMPSTMERQKKNALKYRRSLEDEVRRVKGEINIDDAHSIDLAIQGEIHAAWCRWILKDRLATMNNADILTCSREILRGKETRNRAVRELELDKAASDAFTRFYNSDAADDPSDATQANVANVAGESDGH